MVLDDFLSLIQLAAGLNVAYIAVGVSQGYTQVLLNKVFNIEQHINETFDPIKATIRINQESLLCMKPSNVNGKDTNTQIEEVKRGYELLQEKIIKVEQNIKERASLSCEFRCFSGLSLMMFLHCCTLLFIAPFYSVWFLLPFTAIVFFHSVLGWFVENIKCVCNLVWVICCFALALVVSCIMYGVSYFYDWKVIDGIWGNALIVATALLPMVNFVVFFVKSLSKMRTITKNIKELSTDIENEGKETQAKFELLQNLEQLILKM